MNSLITLDGMTSDDRGYQYRILVKTSEPLDPKDETAIAELLVDAAYRKMVEIDGRKGKPNILLKMREAGKNFVDWCDMAMVFSADEAENRRLDCGGAKAVNDLKAVIAEAEAAIDARARAVEEGGAK